MKKLLYIYIINFVIKIDAMDSLMQWNQFAQNWVVSRIKTEKNTANDFHEKQCKMYEFSLASLNVVLDYTNQNIDKTIQPIINNNLPDVSDTSDDFPDNITESNLSGFNISEKQKSMLHLITSGAENGPSHKKCQKEVARKKIIEIILPNYKTICSIGSTCKNLHKKRVKITQFINGCFQKINAERIANLEILLYKTASKPEPSLQSRIDISLIRGSDWFTKSKIYQGKTEHNPSVFQYPNLLTIASITLNIGRPLFKDNNWSIAKAELHQTVCNIISRLENKPVEKMFTIDDNTWLEELDYCVVPVTSEQKQGTIFILEKQLTTKQKFAMKAFLHLLNPISIITSSVLPNYLMQYDQPQAPKNNAQ
ncbi:hypothetical protein IPH25_02100 [bacterium]|nr:MAG: hypothetical protein IPG37_04230 [bacterium]QQR62216.1 MAG: hypothetical protein IPH25_02100 [bacterium]QQR63222.1 MAG: hypothetical protein IPH67_01980 [bacterium]